MKKICKMMKEAIKDEMAGVKMYKTMGNLSPTERAVFNSIAKDEQRHKEILKGMKGVCK